MVLEERLPKHAKTQRSSSTLEPNVDIVIGIVSDTDIYKDIDINTNLEIDIDIDVDIGVYIYIYRL